jgi:protein involved in temperature-dependent protein secretion
MQEMMAAFKVGAYSRAYDALTKTPEWSTEVGVACGAFLLALAERFDEANGLLSKVQLPGIAAIVNGERQRLARWRDLRAAASLSVASESPEAPYRAALAQALVSRDAALAARALGDLAKVERRVAGTLTFVDGKTRAFDDIADCDAAIGRMLETYVNDGLMYFPFASLSRIEMLPKTNFMDLVMPKAKLTGSNGVAMVYVPLLYAGSSTAEDESIRTGRMTTFDHVGEARRCHGQRDLWVDRSMIGLQGIAAITFAR